MGAALVRGLAAQAGRDAQADRGARGPDEPTPPATPEELAVFDVAPQATATVADLPSVRIAPTAAAAAAAADVVVLCVKPPAVAPLLRQLQPQLAAKLIVSIAAGIRLARLEEAAGPHARVIRVMPNTPAAIHRGVSAYAMGATATAADAAAVESIFGAVGTVFRVAEEMLDAVTALSGSGPAYVFLIIEALADAGVLLGLSREIALPLAAGTVAGAADMVLRTGEHPARLRDQVTSPGGTTIAGLEALEHGGIRPALFAAVRAAANRATELGAR